MKAGIVMHRSRLLVVSALVMVLASCANLFTGNFFENFDGPPDAADILGQYTDSDGNVSSANADAFVSDLLDATDSSRFFEELSSTDRSSLADSLNSVYTNPSVDVDDQTRQQAAILAGEVTLRDTGAGETINKVADVLTSSEGADSFSDPEALLNQIIPESAQGDTAAITQILTDLQSAAKAYTELGGSLSDTDGDGSVDGPDGANMTEVAQNAAVAMIVDQIASQTSAETLAGQIVAGTVGSASYTAPVTNETNLSNILEAGGLGGLLNG